VIVRTIPAAALADLREFTVLELIFETWQQQDRFWSRRREQRLPEQVFHDVKERYASL